MTLLPIAEAQARLFALASRLAVEDGPLAPSRRPLGRRRRPRRAAPSPRPTSPRWTATRSASPTCPAPGGSIGESAAGRPFAGTVGAGEATRIFTGAAMPAGADTVLIQEEAARDGDTPAPRRRRPRASRPQHPPPRPRLHTRRPPDRTPASASPPLASPSPRPAAIATLPVRRRVRVAIAATGDELVAPGARSPATQLPESNGADARRHARRSARRHHRPRHPPRPARRADAPPSPASTPTCSSPPAARRSAITTSSAPRSRPPAARIDFWRIALRPGKPMMAGRLGDADGARPARQSRLRLRHRRSSSSAR